MKESRLPTTISHEIPREVNEIPFFATLPSGILRELIQHCTILHANDGEIIIREGAEDQMLFFLLNGKLQIEKSGQRLAGAWKKGELLGELTHLRGTPRSATLIADGQAQCLKVNPAFTQRLPEIEQHVFQVALYRFLARLLADRLESTSRRLVELEQKGAAA